MNLRLCIKTNWFMGRIFGTLPGSRTVYEAPEDVVPMSMQMTSFFSGPSYGSKVVPNMMPQLEESA